METCNMNKALLQLKQTHMMYISGLSHLLTKLDNSYGSEVSECAAKSFRENTVNTMLQAIDDSTERSIDYLITFLWEPLKSFGFEFSLEKTEMGIKVLCTRCPWVNMFKMMGAEKWGYKLQCEADDELVKKFNPQIVFKRTKTLMEGADCCNHFYHFKPETMD